MRPDPMIQTKLPIAYQPPRLGMIATRLGPAGFEDWNPQMFRGGLVILNSLMNGS